MILALLVAIAAPDYPPSNATARVVVTFVSGDADAVVDAGRVAEAIALRLSGTTVEVLTAPRPGELAWVATVTPHSGGFVEASVTSPTGRLVRSGNLETRGRAADDVTQTIALWVIEALTPVMPELARELPQEQTQVTHAAPPQQQEPSVPRQVSVAMRVGVGAQRLWSTERTVGLITIEGELGFGRHWALVPGIDLSTGFGESDPTFTVSARRAAASLALAWRQPLTGVTLFANAGPILRGLRIGAHGEGITFEDRTFVNPGAELSLGMMTRHWPVDIGVSVRGERYFTRPDVHIDGVSVLDLGSSAIACNVWFQRQF